MYITAPADRGPTNTPRLISSAAAWHRLFGKRSDTTYGDDAIRAIVEVCQTPIWYNRPIGAGAVKATKMLVNGATDVIRVDAKGEGASYNYAAGPPKKGVAVTYNNGELRVYDYDDSTLPIERFYGVVKENFAQKVQEINNTSLLIDIAWLDTSQNPTNVTTDQGLAGGANGAAVSNAEIIGDEPTKKGLYAFLDKTYDPGFLLAPGFSHQSVGLAMADVAQRSRKMAMIDSSFGIGSNVASLIAEAQQYATPFGHAVYVAQWVKAVDPGRGGMSVDRPRSPYRAAHIVFSQQFEGGIANVGAGTQCVYPNVTGFEFDDFNDVDHDVLTTGGVDIPRNFSRYNRGLVSFSAVTRSADPLYTFPSVRIIADVIAASLERSLLDEVWKVIDGEGKLAGRIKARIEQMLEILYRQGVLFGANSADAYRVIPQMSNAALLDQGILGFEVYFKPSPPAKQIFVTLYRTALSVNLRDNTVFSGDIAIA
jgi:phage tail sheath protein FI